MDIISNKSASLSCWLRPPNNDLDSINTFFHNFQITSDKKRDLPSIYNVVIVRDLNAHYNITYPQERSEVVIRLHCFLEANNLNQLITGLTRVTSQHATILDIVITNRLDLILNTGTLVLHLTVTILLFLLKCACIHLSAFAIKREIPEL